MVGYVSDCWLVGHLVFGDFFVYLISTGGWGGGGTSASISDVHMNIIWIYFDCIKFFQLYESDKLTWEHLFLTSIPSFTFNLQPVDTVQLKRKRMVERLVCGLALIIATHTIIILNTQQHVNLRSGQRYASSRGRHWCILHQNWIRR